MKKIDPRTYHSFAFFVHGKRRVNVNEVFPFDFFNWQKSFQSSSAAPVVNMSKIFSDVFVVEFDVRKIFIVILSGSEKIIFTTKIN